MEAATASDFSLFELRVINNFITKKSQQEIADLLDRPIIEVSDVISSLCRHKNITPFQEKKQYANIRRQVQKPLNEKKQAKIISRKIEQQQLEARRKRDEPKFATKQVDYSQMRRVQVNAKTWIYIKPGEDPELAKNNYHNRFNR